MGLSGDRNEAVEQLMNDYGEEMKRLIFTYVRDWTKADDLIQDVFVTIYLKLGTYDGKAPIKHWIYRIAVNKCRDYLRSWHYRNLLFTDKWRHSNGVNEDSPEKQAVAKDQNQMLMQSVLSLPIKYREVILLYYYKDLSVSEISEVLDSGESTIKTRLQRARRILERQLRTRGADWND